MARIEGTKLVRKFQSSCDLLAEFSRSSAAARVARQLLGQRREHIGTDYRGGFPGAFTACPEPCLADA
jgi:hypothetical protein